MWPRWLRYGLALSGGLLAVVAPAAARADMPQPYIVVDDGIPQPLSAVPGDALRGRAIVASRQTGLCLLCHAAPIAEERFQGDLATDLAGAGTRWSEAQLRLRLVDGRRLNPQSPMPAYYRIDGLQRVGEAWQGQPILSAQQIEDVVAYLRSLRE